MDDVSVSALAGEVLGVIGPNGSGKTTLVRVLAGLLKPDSGEVSLGGQSIHAMHPSKRARSIAYMPQSATQHPFTALETVLMGRYPHLGRFGLEGLSDREMAREAMASTGTEEFAARQLDTLSGGERQRVLLARTIAQQGEVMLLDEPTASLDLRHQLSTMEIVRREVAARNIAAVVIVHDLSLAGRYCDRLMLMSEGRVTATGTPDAVLTSVNLRTAFDVETIVEPDPVTGRPHVTLLGASSDSALDNRVGEGVTVHLVCGAGSGRDLMHQLASAGYTVTACVLGQGDTDYETASRLRLEFVPSGPFSPIDDTQDAAHRGLVARADYVVLCDMAIGHNNLRNLSAARGAAKLFAIDGRPTRDLDYTGGEGAKAREQLLEQAQKVSREDLLRTLARRRREAT